MKARNGEYCDRCAFWSTCLLPKRSEKCPVLDAGSLTSPVVLWWCQGRTGNLHKFHNSLFLLFLVKAVAAKTSLFFWH